MLSFKEYSTIVKKLIECYNKSQFIEEFLDNIDEEGMDIGTVTTSDICTNVLPIGTLPRRKPLIKIRDYKKPKEAEQFINDNIDLYKSIYKQDGLPVLMSIAEFFYNR